MTFWLMTKMMIQSLMKRSFNTFDSHELNDFLRICHVLMTLISFFKKSRSLHFNRFRMIIIVLRLSILNFLTFSDVDTTRARLATQFTCTWCRLRTFYLAIEESSNWAVLSMTDYNCLHAAHFVIDHHQTTDSQLIDLFSKSLISSEMINQFEKHQ